MPREELRWWGDALIDGDRYPLAGPVVPEAVPDVVPAFRTGPVGLEHRQGARWWDAHDFSLGIGPGTFDLYRDKQGFLWESENIDAAPGSPITLGYYALGEETVSSSEVEDVPAVPLLLLLADLTGATYLYTIVGNKVRRRNGNGDWEDMGTMTGVDYGQAIARVTQTSPNQLLFAGGAKSGEQCNLYVLYAAPLASDRGRRGREAAGTEVTFGVFQYDMATAPGVWNDVKGVSVTTVGHLETPIDKQRVLVGHANGRISTYVMSNTVQGKARLRNENVRVGDSPFAFLAGDFPYGTTEGFWGLSGGELWNFYIQGYYMIPRLRWGRGLGGGCMHGRQACVFSGLRVWLVDSTGRADEISPPLEREPRSETDEPAMPLRIAGMASDGTSLYMALTQYVPDGTGQRTDYLWRWTDGAWHPIVNTRTGERQRTVCTGLGAYNPKVYGSYGKSNVDTDLAVGNVASSEARAQSFRLITTPVLRDPTNLKAKIGFVRLWLKKVGTPTDNLTVAVYDDASGVPTGSPLATSNVVAGSGLGTSYDWVLFEFSTLLQLTGSSPRHLVLERSGSVDASNYYVWGADGSSPSYTAGQASRRASGVWNAEPSYDHAFEIQSRYLAADELDDQLFWLLTDKDGAYLRTYYLPGGIRQSAGAEVADAAWGYLYLPSFTGGSPEEGRFYTFWIEHTIPASAKLKIECRTAKSAAYSTTGVVPYEIVGGATVTRKATMVVIDASQGRAFSTFDVRVRLQANSAGGGATGPSVHGVAYHWYKATRILRYPVPVTFHTLPRVRAKALVDSLLALEPDDLHTLTIPYVVKDAYVRLVSTEATADPETILLNFETVR